MARPLRMTSRTNPLDWPNREVAPLARNVGGQEAAAGAVSSGTHHLDQFPDFLYTHSHKSGEWTVNPNISMIVFAMAKSKQLEDLYLPHAHLLKSYKSASHLVETSLYPEISL